MNEKSMNMRKTWLLLIVTAVFILLIFFLREDFSFVDALKDRGLVFLWLGGIAFFAEYIDSALGMGFGIIMFPMLLISGYNPVEILSAILFTECITGIAAGWGHQKAGNVDFKPETRAREVLKLLLLTSILGSIPGLILTSRLNVKGFSIYIGIIYIIIGITTTLSMNLFGKYNTTKLKLLGIVAGFNKGVSGSGFGPLLTGAQVEMKIPAKSAVAITSLTEGAFTFFAIIIYSIIKGAPVLSLIIPVTVGALCSIPLAVWTVADLPKKSHSRSIGVVMALLGILTLLKQLNVI
jgi:hypothetical protein